MGSEVQVWHLSIRLKLHHHYMKDFQFFSLSLCVSFVSFLLISFWNTAHPRKKKIHSSNPVMWEKLLPFSVFSFYLFHSPGSNLSSSLPFWKRTPCRNEIHHGEFSVSRGFRHRAGGKRACSYRFTRFVWYEICNSHDRNTLR